jgi:hypothetical protein
MRNERIFFKTAPWRPKKEYKCKQGFRHTSMRFSTSVFFTKGPNLAPESYPKCVSNTESNFPRYSNSKLIPHTCWIWKFHFLSSLGVYSILLHVDRYRNEIHKSRILNPLRPIATFFSRFCWNLQVLLKNGKNRISLFLFFFEMKNNKDIRDWLFSSFFNSVCLFWHRDGPNFNSV